MEPNQLFAQALPLPHPWTVTSSALEGNPKKLAVTVGLLEITKQLPCSSAASSAGSTTAGNGDGGI